MLNWVDKVEQYFEFERTSNEVQVQLASYYPEGEAHSWWHRYTPVNAYPCDRQFERGIMLGFGSTELDHICFT